MSHSFYSRRFQGSSSYTSSNRLSTLSGLGMRGGRRLAWGGPNNSTLFITANTSVYRIRMKVAGQPIPGNEPR